MELEKIDGGQAFDFGKTSEGYAMYRDIYPESMYKKLIGCGIGKRGQEICDLGSGTAVLPINMHATGAKFTSTDISENQIAFGKRASLERGFSDIRFKVCSAEDTGFKDGSFDAVTAVQCFHYFNAEKAAREIWRVLKPQGLFAKIFMDWLPFQDEKINEMEQLVLKYNPRWSGGGFKKYDYRFPEWARGLFTLEHMESYDETLRFSKEAWLKRVLTCRGVGASLSENKTAEFEKEYRAILEKYSDPLLLKHQIHIEVYKKTMLF